MVISTTYNQQKSGLLIKVGSHKKRLQMLAVRGPFP